MTVEELKSNQNMHNKNKTYTEIKITKRII